MALTSPWRFSGPCAGCCPGATSREKLLLQGKNLPQAPEDSHEARIRCILQERGPVMQRKDLFRIARAQGVSEAVVERWRSKSNVFVRLTKKTYGLIESCL